MRPLSSVLDQNNRHQKASLFRVALSLAREAPTKVPNVIQRANYPRLQTDKPAASSRCSPTTGTYLDPSPAFGSKNAANPP